MPQPPSQIPHTNELIVVLAAARGIPLLGNPSFDFLQDRLARSLRIRESRSLSASCRLPEGALGGVVVTWVRAGFASQPLNRQTDAEVARVPYEIHSRGQGSSSALPIVIAGSFLQHPGIFSLQPPPNCANTRSPRSRFPASRPVVAAASARRLMRPRSRRPNASSDFRASATDLASLSVSFL
jgi:hypothetical protein